MGKRIVRIFRRDLKVKTIDILNHEADIIMDNGKTFHGIVISVGDEFLFFKDMRGDRLQVSLGQISEIQFDKEASY